MTPSSAKRWSPTELRTLHHEILDVFRRYVPGWLVAPRESGVLAERLIAGTIAKGSVALGTADHHADQGSAMSSEPVALLLADQGVAKSHSRPRTSSDTGSARRSSNPQVLRTPAKWLIRRLASYLTRTRMPDRNPGFRADARWPTSSSTCCPAGAPV